MKILSKEMVERNKAEKNKDKDKKGSAKE